MSCVKVKRYKKGTEKTRVAILDFMQDYMEKYKIPPTVREIADALGHSSSTIHNQLMNLIADGILVQTSAGKSRNIMFA